MRTIVAVFLLTATWYVNEHTKDQIKENEEGWGLFMFLCFAGLLLCLTQDVCEIIKILK